jgi:tRNA(fMet)-specific endonuclease VapC
VTLYILDTDHISLLQRSHPNLKQRFDSMDKQDLSVTVVTLYEQMRGWQKIINHPSGKDQLIWAFDGLRNTVLFFQTLNIIRYDPIADDCFKNLLSQRIRIGTQDLRIAAIALSKNAIVVTRNQRDFNQVPGLQITDWT